jgi:hemolysin III
LPVNATHPEYHLGDIVANAVTHGVGAVLAVAGCAALIVLAVVRRATPVQLTSCAVFGGTLVLVYVCSTLYHSLVRTRARHVLQILDHSSIYLLIAGTYTPFTLVVLRGRVGWLLFAIVWTMAIGGIVFKCVAMGKLPALSVMMYIVMGYLVVAALPKLASAVGWQGLMWLLGGGILYTVGIVFFALDRVRYFHALWHVFVLGGSALHFVAVLLYVVPARA